MKTEIVIVDQLAPLLRSPDYQVAVEGVSKLVKVGSSDRVYVSEARLFAEWLHLRGYHELDRDALIAYHAYLRTLSPNTAARKWSIVHTILSEMVERGSLAKNPADHMPGFSKKESNKHIALSEEEAKRLLAAIDTTTALGKRDYAMLRLLIRTGLRRFECAGLKRGDIHMRQGHHLLLVHGKGDEEDLVKLPADLWRTLIDYQEAVGYVRIPSADDGSRQYEALEWQVGQHVPLFIAFRRGDHPNYRPIGDDVVYRTVLKYAKAAKIAKLTTHSLRASFITLTLDKEVPLHLVQDAARHKDPRTTRSYDKKRKQRFDRNAVDALDI